ncbi:glycosyltransferase [Mycolicibacterium smegmatis]|uniref:glycosyltransferase n=1 Tax=Mycolicibacterium smegmatis TaxID=1772 RepID=UPI0005D9D850|nr:glycosyltransferase [Mycolicibacterium smegmatis]MDF1897929.1 glycosyltransferase [Mycolicibacterium smegmatis]MDF1905044.1 glycosyltransferase [Mycolicibacterium smegmatis]MDF1916688.1 glycosyltransferase [Mycolicibacterium smegmatis]MDF1923378.1 glycosyltransferase [Mycolicibacterium smegmatis]UAK52668.1 glycosyltransferase [Mycolicibacterium smegmatis]
MKFALACYGTRGDVEPSVAIGRELQDRGHGVRMAVPPELVGFAKEAGLEALTYGPPLEDFLREDFLREFWNRVIRNPVGTLRELWAPIARYWPDTAETLFTVADGADLLSTGLNFEQPAANVAEYYKIPLVGLHHFPMRPNGKLIPALPAAVVRSGGTLTDWLLWRSTRKVEDMQRRELGLPKATAPASRRIAEHGWLEIQAYDAVSVPGLASEWARWGAQRPFTGALTMGLPTADDSEVTAWIEAGSAPICFATGSIPLASPADTLAMIGAACAELGQRALLCAGGTDFTGVRVPQHVKVVGAVNYAEIFPACRAVVHHGGSGTTAASLRAAVPTLILWSSADQPYWGNQLKRLKVGTARRFSSTTTKTLVSDLHKVLAEECLIRARAVAAQMTQADASVRTAADLFEATAEKSSR